MGEAWSMDMGIRGTRITSETYSIGRLLTEAPWRLGLGGIP